MRVIKYGTRLDDDKLPRLVREMSKNYSGRSADSPDKVFGILRDIEDAENLAQEKFWLFCLDARLQLIGYFELFAGGADFCYIDNRVLFTSALAVGANRLIVAHNHPSGYPVPSKKDMDLTEDIISGAKLLGMTLLDHVIIGYQGQASIRELHPEIF